MTRKHLQHFRNIDRLIPGALFAAIMVGGLPLHQAAAADKQLVKVSNKNIPVGVDNGWVAFEDPTELQDSTTLPEVTHYVVDSAGDFGAAKTFKLRALGNSLSNGGPDATLGGVVFAPSTLGKSLPSGSAGVDGVGILFGEAYNQGGGAGSSIGGWVTDDSVIEHLTNSNGNPGSISAVAVNPTNGSFAVGWDLATTGYTQGIVMPLNAAKQTYVPTGKTYLGTLGGETSQALSISVGATYIVGAADDASGESHAVYAKPGDTAWTDITGSFPASVLKSAALVATDSGLIAGTATVKQDTAGRTDVSVDEGFLYNVATQSVVFFPVSGANVTPMAILPNGNVVGELALVVPKGAPTGTLTAYHPFLFNGSTVTDFGTMVVSSSPAYGCRVNGANGAGELVGSCIASSTGPYGASGTAFYINAANAEAAFVDLNTVLLNNGNAATKAAAKGYNFGSATAIDAEEEISLYAVEVKKATNAAFLISKNAYLP